MGQWGVLTIDTVRELKYRNLSLRSHYHDNIFAHCLFSVTVVS